MCDANKMGIDSSTTPHQNIGAAVSFITKFGLHYCGDIFSKYYYFKFFLCLSILNKMTLEVDTTVQGVCVSRYELQRITVHFKQLLHEFIRARESDADGESS